MIQQREKRGDKDNRRQHLKGKRKAHRRNFLPDFPEYKFRADKREAEQPVHVEARDFKNPPPQLKTQNKKGEGQLQEQPPPHGLQANRPAIGGEHIRQGKHREHAKYPCKSSHAFSFACDCQQRFAAHVQPEDSRPAFLPRVGACSPGRFTIGANYSPKAPRANCVISCPDENRVAPRRVDFVLGSHLTRQRHS